MKKTAILLVLILALLTPYSLRAQEDEEAFIAILKVDSAFTRALPTRESERLASVFEDEQLEVVGRSVDGTWFEVRRRGRLNNLGWILVELLDYPFDPARLPITDLVTGLEGPTPLEADPGFAVFLQFGVIMRDSPSRFAPMLRVVPINSTVPILERNQDGTWLRINYRGYVGWIIAFVGRDIPNVMDIPEAANLPPLSTVPIVIIPPEVQKAQIEELRVYIIPLRDLSQSLEWFWLAVDRGEIMPCNPPPEATEYLYTRDDVRQLPELDRYAPQLNDAVAYLNESVDPLENCGVVTIEAVRHARSDAINARILFYSALGALEVLEETIH
jgi:hypothetical protein